MKHNIIDIWSTEVSRFDDQLVYKKAVLAKLPLEEDAFYFDDMELVDGLTDKTIRGVELERSTWKEITNKIVEHFNIPL